MAQIVIDIDDKTYEAFMEVISVNPGRSNYKGIIGKCLYAIKHGVVLPKGHGRLADMDEAIKCIEEVADSKEKQYALYLVDWACSKRVLIEADKN